MLKKWHTDVIKSLIPATKGHHERYFVICNKCGGAISPMYAHEWFAVDFAQKHTRGH